MTAAVPHRGEGFGAPLRWAACLLLVLGLHAGAVWVLLRRPAPFTPPPAAPEAVMLDLAPEPAPAAPEPALAPAPDPVPEPLPVPVPVPEPPSSTAAPAPEPPPVEASPPVETTPPMEPPALPAEPPPPPVPSLPQPAVVLPEPPPPPPAPKRPEPPRPARLPPRPAQASPSRSAPEVPAPSAAPAPAPPPAASAASSVSAFPGWRSDLINRLQRAKRYPDVARAREEQGAAAVTFTMDRSGHVLSAKLVRSSGFPSLDEEALAMVRRADPLPPMPSELPGSTLTLTVPVTFSLR